MTHRSISQKQSDRVSALDVRMGHTVCVLGLFLLNMLLYCGHAQDILLSVEPNWSTLFTGETVTFMCDVRGGEVTDWYYSVMKDGQLIPSDRSAERFTSPPLTPEHSGEYQCVAANNISGVVKGSNKVSLTVSERPKAQLSKGFPTEDSVTLTCSVGSSSSSSSGWKYFWYRDKKTSEPLNTPDVTVLSAGQIRVSGRGRVYWCRGGRGGNPVYYTEYSDPVVTIRAVVTPQPNWPEIYSGETITLTCEVKDGGDAEWEYEWKTPRSYTPPNPRVSMIRSSLSGGYRCYVRLKDETFSTTWSNAFTLNVYQRPKARLSKGSPVGGRVILTCSVGSSSSSSSSSSPSGWTYFWYRSKKTSEPLNTPDVTVLSTEQISVSGGRGIYWCRGGRGDPVYYTEYSNPVGTVTNRAVVTPQTNWPEIYSGETITLTCEVKDGGDAEWEYVWKTPRSYTPPNPRVSMIRPSLSGDYRCKGRLKDEAFSTEWSDTLKVSEKPQPVLTVSPSWLSPGDSVTLNCSVEHPSAGWRFFWFKAVPKLSHHSYSYELLPGSTDGTEQDSYIVHGQTHTAGYVCRAGRGDPVFYTLDSRAKFVWSGDLHPAASLSVSPDRVQHFNEESLSLSCEGNSTEWRVSRFIKSGSLTHCSAWGTMTGSTCNVNDYWTSGVFWCESQTQFSNAANITNQYGDVILVSPVRPVTEGHSVTLGCKLKTQNVLHDVDFYKNGKLIQDDTREELIISAVTKSDEGFYKCRGTDSTQGLRSLMSAESWLSVKYAEDPAASSAFPVLLVVGLLCGVLLIILLLLFLYRCRKSTDSSVMRSQRTNQSPATDHVTQDSDYASPLDDEFGVTYSVVELRNIPKKRRNKEPDESAVYSDVKTASAADDNLLYAQVHPRTKDKKAKGKSRCAAAEETVYSEVNPGAHQ